MIWERMRLLFCRRHARGLFFLLFCFPAAASAQADRHEVTLERGTRLELNIRETLSTKNSQEGDQFTAVVERSVVRDGVTILPVGTRVIGTVSRVKRPGRFRGKAELTLCFHDVSLADGRQQPIMATITRLRTPTEKKLGEKGRVQSAGTKRRDALIVLGGGAGGAGIGALSGGKKGAVIGSAAGSLAGVVGVLWTRGKDIVIPVNTAVEVVLEKPLAVPTSLATNASDRP